MTESPYGSDPTREQPREEPEQQPEQQREQAPPTEQVPVQPAAGSSGFARPSSGTSYGTGTPEPSSAGTASWSSGSYGAPTASVPTTQPDHGQPAYGQPAGPTPSYGSPYGDPYAATPGVPAPPWGGQPEAWPGAPGGPGQFGQPGQPGQPGQFGAPRSPGFLASLFDTSFDRFVTPVVAKVAYLVVIVAVGLTWVANVVGALLTDPPYGLVVLVVGGVIALVTVIGARVLIEAVLALIRLAEDTRALRDKAEGGTSS